MILDAPDGKGSYASNASSEESVLERLIWRPTDPSFQTTLHTLFPTIDSVPSLNPYAPYLLILINNTGYAIKGYDLDWVLTGASGRQRTINQTFSRGHIVPSAQDKTIAVGRAQLLSPQFSLSQADLQRPVSTLIPAFSLPPTTGSITVNSTLNCLVLLSGEVVGASPTRLSNLHCLSRNAQHDLGLSVVLQTRKDNSHDALSALLQQHIKLGYDYSALEGRKAFYMSEKAKQAQLLLPVLHRDPSKFLRLAKVLSSYPKDKHRVSTRNFGQL